LPRSTWSLGNKIRRCGPLTLHEALRAGQFAGHAWRCRGPETLREAFLARSLALSDAIAGGLRAATKVGTTSKGTPFRIDALPAGQPALVWIDEVRLSEEDARDILRSAAQCVADLHAGGIVHGALSLESLFLDNVEGKWRATLWRPAPVLTGFTPLPSPPGFHRTIDIEEDVFGLGYCIASMLLGRPIPRRAPTWLDDRPGPVVELGPLISDPTLSLVLHRLIDRSPQRRLSAAAVLETLGYLDHAPPARVAPLELIS